MTKGLLAPDAESLMIQRAEEELQLPLEARWSKYMRAVKQNKDPIEIERTYSDYYALWLKAPADH